ncbi:nucleotide sugar dehydratase [Oribacterium sp. C9]|uniref:NAD-dependent epimerase/dehydratase family protein n=1 Tax=Oribacterium sp. C9 TaxID=1943579 RepID=UPI0009901846|nr:NAD(P)-dependent oxidoreductase [Oribacterium sp. C9]OON84925.1 nucleotide sugar dehydratase [Oribacterium sp. C9]
MMFHEFSNKCFLITGATGLIGQSLSKSLLSYGGKIIAVVRDQEKAKRIFGEDGNISYIVSDVTELEIKRYDVDYIIHAAACTSSREFINNPVGVINVAIEGTRRTLEIAKMSGVKGYLYLSSMEVYGTPVNDEIIDEMHSTNLNTMSPRSAYPESKRTCECLCASYFSQFNVPVKVVRLTQTFGPGVLYNDGRVFAEFARCVIESRNIILHTKGDTKRSYLYTEDAVGAILTVLLKGKNGEAYNAANEETYCSIYEMAEMVASEIADNDIKVIVEEKDITSFGYAPTLHMNLDTEKIKNLGWEAKVGLKEMYERLIEDMKS